MASEKNFENRIKDYLKEQHCWFIKYWAGSIYTKEGIPDILVCCNGYFLAVEVKAPKGKPSELQKYNVDKINRTGGFAVVLYPDQFEDFKTLVGYLNEFGTIDARLMVHKINRRWWEHNADKS